jgi:hypothetical protein
MSVTTEIDGLGTGGALSEKYSLRRPPDLPESSSVGVVSEELAERARKFGQQLGSRSTQRVVLLGVLLAEFGDAPFEDVAIILGVKPDRLERMMHGTETIPSNRQHAWESVAGSLQRLHRIIKRDATWQWLNTEIPDLDYETPYKTLLTRMGTLKIESLTLSYLDVSFT